MTEHSSTGYEICSKHLKPDRHVCTYHCQADVKVSLQLPAARIPPPAHPTHGRHPRIVDRVSGEHEPRRPAHVQIGTTARGVDTL